MNNYNYSYSSPNSSSLTPFSQYSSTPSNNTRFQRPRFGYAGPPSYPRPRSSASKPNPGPYPDNMTAPGFDKFKTFSEPIRDYSHGYTDSMVNNYGDSTMSDSPSFSNSRNTFGDSQISSNSTDYYTPNDSFYSPPKSLLSDHKSGLSNFGGENRQVSSLFYSNTGGLSSGLSTNLTGTTGSYENTNRGYQAALSANIQASFASNIRGKASLFGNTRGSTRGRFQKKPRGGGRGRGGAMQSTELGSTYGSRWNCKVCHIVFTSQIPLEMHLRGARHAKKLKSQTALAAVQDQVSQVKEIEKPDGKKYYCELCSVVTNSSLQLQMHLDGTKHKNKLNPPKEPGKEGEKNPESEVNGKSNGGIVKPGRTAGVVRSAPSDFDEHKPTKMAKFACEICDVIMNSDVQLQQHLSSKKHEAKVEGRPIIKKRKPKEGEAEQPTEENPENAMAVDKPELTNVVGVKTLSASFVAGETLE